MKEFLNKLYNRRREKGGTDFQARVCVKSFINQNREIIVNNMNKSITEEFRKRINKENI